jgi:hypothetical protein
MYNIGVRFRIIASTENHIITDLINALPINSSLNTVQHTAINEALFPMSIAQSSGKTTGLCNPFLTSGSVKLLSSATTETVFSVGSVQTSYKRSWISDSRRIFSSEVPE